MPSLVPGIHELFKAKAWMAGVGPRRADRHPAMTSGSVSRLAKDATRRVLDRARRKPDSPASPLTLPLFAWDPPSPQRGEGAERGEADEGHWKILGRR